VVLSALTAGALGFWFVLVTHRLCGPLVRLHRYMCEVADGKLPDVYPVRKKDELQDLFTAFERLVQRLKQEQVFSGSVKEPTPQIAAPGPSADGTWNVELEEPERVKS
jgi:HAMP domain-containing protein